MSAFAQSAARVEPKLPLYLVSASACSVHADGGALLLRSRSAAPRRFPLVHLSRVVSSVENSWDGAALALCLRANLPVVFLDGCRGSVGWLLAREHTPARLSEVIEEILARPSWRALYSNWLRAERNRAVTAWRGAFPGQSAPGYQVEAWRKRFVYQQADEAYPAVPALWRAAVDSLVLRILTDAGLPAIFHACDGGALEMARDCGALACLHLFPDASGAMTSAARENGFLLSCFEARAECLRYRLIAALLRLQRVASQELHRWR